LAYEYVIVFHQVKDGEQALNNNKKKKKQNDKKTLNTSFPLCKGRVGVGLIPYEL